MVKEKDYIPSCMHFEEAITRCPTVRKDVFIRLRGIGSHPVNDFRFFVKDKLEKSPHVQIAKSLF